MPINPTLTSQKNQAKPGSTRVGYTEISAEERQRRARAIQSMAVLDTPPEEGFDALARLAAHVSGAPIALVSLIDEDRVWFKAAHGLDIHEGMRKQSFCVEAANSKRVLEVVNATLDPRFSENLVVTGDPGVVYYAGAPILYEGVGIGTVCVLDYVSRKLPPEKLQALAEMATIAITMLRARIEAFSFFSKTR